MNRTGKMVASSVFIAFGVMLPMVFHFAGALGPVFLPMHIPVLIAGLFLGAFPGFAVGVLTPLLSSLMTGMPPAMPTLPVMVAELAVYGAVGGCLYKSRRCSLVASLLAAMVFGRLAAAVMVYFMAVLFHINLTPAVYLAGAVVAGLPGLAIQLTVVPLIVRRLESVFAR